MKTVPEQIITPENLSRFCYTNAPLLKRDLRGVILTFHGRGEPGFLSHSPFSKELAEKGIIQIFPYYGPWAWMNSGAVKITDALVSAVYERWAGGKDVPLVCEGGSMGGLAALIYPVLGRRKPAAAAANCPACDLVHHFSARKDLPRYFLCAYGGGGEASLQETLKRRSPMHRINDMPDIPFLLVHGLSDRVIEAAPNSERFCALMEQAGKNARYVPVEGMGHCDMPPGVSKEYYDFILSFFE